MIRFFLLCYFIGLSQVLVVAQVYKPCDVYQYENSEILRKELKKQLKLETARFNPINQDDYKAIEMYGKRTDALLKRIDDGGIIRNDSLQFFVDRVLLQLLSKNAFTRKPKRVLILKDPVINAMSVGEGTILVSIGLLGRLTNESELAFVLAHELAHYELDHTYEDTNLIIKSKYIPTVKKAATNLLDPRQKKIGSEVDTLKTRVYAMQRISREQELQADSLGMLLASRAGYNEYQGLRVLEAVEHWDACKHDVADRIFEPLDLPDYPFKDEWLTNRLRIFEKSRDTYFIFARDSIETHPETPYRLEVLRKKVKYSGIPLNLQDDNLVDSVIKLAEFEMVNAAIFSKQWDYGLMLALQNRLIYKDDPATVSHIATILMQVLDYKDKSTYGYLPQYVTNFSVEHIMVNYFLHNIKAQELGELTYSFLTDERNFNPQEEEHYLLLWKICNSTYQHSESKRVKAMYRQQFPKGKFLSEMK